MNDNTAVMAAYGLQKAYGACRALDGVNMQVRRGDVYGLVGRNGAGKTTLMRMVTGQSEPSGGEMELFGASGKNMRPQRCRTGAMIEIPSFSPFLTAHENLEYYRLQRGIPGKHVVDEVLEQVDLTDTGKKKFKAFSLGMKQRLGLASALLGFPKLLILDEPTNGLDPSGISEMRELICTLPSRYGITVVVSSHLLSEIDQMADHVGIIRKGTLVFQDTLKSLHTHAKQQIALRTDRPQETLSLLHRGGLEAAPQEDGYVMLPVIEDEHIANLCRQICEQGIALYRIEKREKSLEDIFLSLTGKETSL